MLQRPSVSNRAHPTGRAELPESLKALFRPITVVVPDRQLIMENMLMAEVGLAESRGCKAARAWRVSVNSLTAPRASCCCHPAAILLLPPIQDPSTQHALLPQGFVEAKMLAKKFASLYFLLEDLLSPAKHYDW